MKTSVFTFDSFIFLKMEKGLTLSKSKPAK